MRHRLLLLVTLLLLALPAHAQSELEKRLQLARVPGVTFEVAPGQAGKPAAIKPRPDYGVNWASAPSHVVPLTVDATGARVLLESNAGQPLLLARDKTLIVAMQPEGATLRWLYFNYVLYCAASEVAGTPALPYGEWPHSPVPHDLSRLLFGVGAVLAWTVFIVAFQRARRRGDAEPNAYERFFAGIQHHSETSRASERDLLWNQVGFARPLAGLLTLLGSMSFMVGAYFLIQWVLSAKVQPFPEAEGLWSSTWDILILVAALFEFGTNLAVQKYFAEHRALNPREALKDIQFYVWWALFQRLCQATLLVGIAVGWLPYSNFAIYAPFVTLFGIKGMPALFQLGKLVCSGLQRFDYLNMLDMLEQRVLRFLIPIPVVLLGRQWGLEHPQYGEAFGAALGLGLGHMASQVFMLFLGLFVVRRLGVPIDTLFMAQFDRGTARRQLVFGGKIAVGSEPVFLLKAVESFMIANMMSDFTAWLGIHQLLTGRLLWLFFFAQSFYGGAMPAISEAFSAGKHKLTQYYVARYFEFGALYQMTIFSLLMAIGPAFIHALGPQWERAIPFLVLAMLQGVFSTPAWISDSFQQGTGRPGMMLLVMFIEQGTRLALFFLLVPRLQFAGILLATVAALAVKDVVGWVLNHRYILPLRLSLHAALLAPVCAGAVNYGLWKGVVTLLPPADSLQVLLLVCVASATSFLVTFFVCGLAGGYGPSALDEFARAAQMCTFMRGMAQAMSWCAHAGARLSPLRPGDPAWRDEAYLQAAELDAAAVR